MPFTTIFHAKFFAYDLVRRHASNDVARLSQSLFDASVDLNPHQIEAALFALKSPISKGVLLADGVVDFNQLTANDLDQLFGSVDVGEVWGVGRRLKERLYGMGIQTVKDLRDSSVSRIKKEFNVVLARTLSELNGESCLALEEVAPPQTADRFIAFIWSACLSTGRFKRGSRELYLPSF